MTVFDIEALGELPALPARNATAAERQSFWNAWAEASFQKEADYLQGDDTAHRKTWEA